MSVLLLKYGIQTAVTAEHAPIGVQIWPTRAPKYAPAFTLESVAVTRTINGAHVTWTYENGATRTFNAGQRVIVKAVRP